MFNISTRQCLYSLALCLLLSACTAPVKQSDPDIVEATDNAASQEAVQALLLEARKASSPERERHIIAAAEQLIVLGDNEWADNLLASISREQLQQQDLWHYTLVYSRLAIAQNNLFTAQQVLMNPALNSQWELMPKETYVTIRQLRGQLMSTLGETQLAIREYVALDRVSLAPVQATSNQVALWQTLMAQPQWDLERLAGNSESREELGWYQLAILSKNNQNQLEAQLAGVEQWRAQWPDHPAAQHLPQDLQLLQQLIAEQPKQIALLLPVTGRLARAGKAIQDGFFAAYYEAVAAGHQSPSIQVYDSNTQDIAALYQQAVDQGAELIIGPLDKDKVAELALLPSLPVPTLALNRSEQNGSLPPPPQLVQFSLAAEDEARQAARRAWLEGHRLAMVIAPEASWADRAAVAFIAEWNQLGGTVVDYAKFTGKADYSKIISRALLIDQSKARAAQVRNILGRTMEYEPRRRQDVDMIFLTALPNQARQVKPTLKFHLASDIPVYATSHIYTGEPDSKLDSDMNGIRFSTLPWIFDTQRPEKLAIDAYSRDPAFNRLYAMGVDAFYLYPRLRQLREINGTRVFGATGNLQLNTMGQIEREQMWASIRRGRAVPMPMVVSRQDQED